MDFEIIKKELEIMPMALSCFACKSQTEKNYNYMLMKDMFLCDICYKKLCNQNSPIDDKFLEIDNKLTNLLNGMVDKNNRIRDLEDIIKKTDTNINLLLDIINKFVENDNNI